MNELDKHSPRGEPQGYFLLLPPPTADSDEFSLQAMLLRLWRGRWWLVAFAAVFTAIAAVHAFTTERVYRSETTIVVRSDDLQGTLSGLRSQLGGLASIAGINLGSSADRRSEYLAVLKARQLAREFVEAHGLMPVLFSDSWDADGGKFRPDDEGRVPTLMDGADYLRYICKVREDLKSGLITVSVEWKDPQVAARWARDYVAFANRQLQQEAVRNAEQSIKYLNDEIARTTLEPVRQSLFRMLESRLSEVMVASVQPDYAFKVIDRAEASQPHQFVRPKPLLEIIVGFICGLMFGAIFVTWRYRT